MPKLTKQEKHKKREANRAKLHAKQKKPQPKVEVPEQVHQPGMAFRHHYDPDTEIHTVSAPMFGKRSY